MKKKSGRKTTTKKRNGQTHKVTLDFHILHSLLHAFFGACLFILLPSFAGARAMDHFCGREQALVNSLHTSSREVVEHELS